MSNQLQISGAAKIRSIQGPVVANSGVITALDGDASQYVRGDGTLADFPTSTGGGSSVSYYLNTSVSQGTIGGVAYKQLSKVPISGAGTDVSISADGYIANYLTDANDPALLEVPAGNFNCEFYFSVNSNAHNPYVYAEVYKYDGTTFTLLGSSVSVPEYLTNGTTLSPYYFAIPVATSVLTITDRIAVRIFVNVDGRTVTLHTENNHLCQVVTTFSKGLTTLNSLTRQVQFFQTGTSGTDFAISSSVATHTFNLPVASAANTGKLSSTDWSTFNNKVPYTGATANVDLGIYNLTAAGVTANSFYAQGNGTQGGYLYLKQGIVPYGTLAGSNSISADGTKYIYLSDAGSNNSKTAIFQLGSITNNTERTYTLPDATGTLALTSDLSSYVPYTGATGGVDIGIYNLSSNALIVNGTVAAGGCLNLKQNATTVATGIGYNSIGAKSANSLQIYYGGATVSDYKTILLNVTNLTNTSIRTFEFPDASGTIALLSGTQTFTGATTFSSDITVNSVRVGRGSGSINTNTVLGSDALNANTTGASNVAIGIDSLKLNTTGGSNVGVGQTTLQNNNGNQNTAIGCQAMQLNTNGVANTGIGHTALQNNTTGNNNIAMGISSLNLNTTGSYNSALGSYSLLNNTTGNSNTAVGYSSLSSNTTGIHNTTIGFDSLSANTTGNENTGLGHSALKLNTIGQYNTALGSSALYYLTTGSNNTAIGRQSGLNITLGDNNIAIGNESLRNTTIGTSNTSIGVGALYSNTTGGNNIAIGYNSATSITTGSNNTIIGGYVGTAGMSNNIVLADGAGNIRYQWNGTNNVFGNPISGTSATFSSSVQADFLVVGTTAATSGGLRLGTQVAIRARNVANTANIPLIESTASDGVSVSNGALILASTGAATFSSSVNMGGDLALTPTDSAITFSSGAGRFFTGGAERMRIRSDGNTTIGFTDGYSNIRLNVRGVDTTSSNFVIHAETSTGTNFYVRNDGLISTGSKTNSPYNNTTAIAANVNVASDGVISRSTASSLRFKENINDWNGGLDIILALKPKTFNYKKDYYDKADIEFLGLIAEDVAEVSPYLADYENEDRTGQVENVRYATIVVPLIKAIQELEARIKQLENK